MNINPRLIAIIAIGVVLGFILAALLACAPPKAEATPGCIGPSRLLQNGTSEDVLQKYEVDFGSVGNGGEGTAKIRESLTSVYIDCPNGNRPRKLKPMAEIQCYTVVDYNTHTIAKDTPRWFKIRFHQHFVGVNFFHRTFQPGYDKQNSPPDQLTEDDGTRHACEIFQIPLEDRKWFGRIMTDRGKTFLAWAAATRMQTRSDAIVDSGRQYYPNRDWVFNDFNARHVS
jgi:hypothetical protein